MSKITLSTVSSFQNDVSSVAAFNANMATLQTAIDYLLSRDGTSPNQMTADLDMNGKKIINLPTGSTSTEPVTQDQLSALVLSSTSGSITNGSIVEAHFSSGAVSTRALADNSVTSAKIVDGTIAAGDLASNSVTTAKIVDANVTFPKLPTIATQTVLGNSTGSTATVATITFADLATALSSLLGVSNVPVGTVSAFAGSRVQSGYVLANGGTLARTGTYANLFAWMCPTLTQTSTAAFTVATSLVNWTNHPFSNWDRVVFSTTGALPTGVATGNGVTGTTYYVRDVTTNSFKLATTVGGAALAMSGTASGNTTILGFGFGLGDGSTTFTLPDIRGEFIRGHDLGRGIDANRALASFQDHQLQSHIHTISAGASTSLAGSVASDFWRNGTSNTSTPLTTGANAANVGTETRPRNITLTYGIKY